MRKKPTLCQLLHGLTVGGAEVLASRLAERLGDRYRFLFVCLDEIGELGAQLRDSGVDVELLGRRPGIDWRCARRLARLLKQHQVDLVQAHQYTPFFYSLASRLWGSSLPVLFTEHGRFHPDLPSRKRKYFNRLFLKRQDRVVAVGEAVRQALNENEGIPADRIEIVHNGIDLSPYQQPVAPSERDATRAALGLRPEDFVLVQVARLDSLKDHCTAVRMMERLVTEDDRVRLLLVGDGPERRRIEAETAKRGVDRFVRLLGFRQDVPRLLRAADLSLLTSISEGIPLTLIEAMAAGLPVVSTDVGGVAEVVDDAKTGLLVPAGDDRAAAEAVARLSREPRLRDELGRCGRQRAEDRFSEIRMHARFERIIESMLERKTSVEPAAAL